MPTDILLLFLLVCSSRTEEWKIETGLAHPPRAVDSRIWNHQTTFLGFRVKASVPFCRSDRVPDLVIGCLSADNNQMARNVIRSTWARTHERHNRTILVWFLMATPGRPELLEEARQHNDMFFVNVQDGYRHGLTPKVQVFFSIAAELFPNTPWFMKTDDDAYVFLDRFFERMDSQKDPMGHPTAIGFLMRNQPAIRDPESKWFVPVAEYPRPIYPIYMNGIGIVLSNNLVKCYTPHLSTEDYYFFLEDVYLGYLLEKYCHSYATVDLVPHYEPRTNYKLGDDKGKFLVHGIKKPEYFLQLWQENCDSMAFCEPLEHTVAQGERTALDQATPPAAMDYSRFLSPQIPFIASLIVFAVLVVRIMHRQPKSLRKSLPP